MAPPQGIRSIGLDYGILPLRSLEFTVEWTTDPRTTPSFLDPNVYAKRPDKRKEALMDATLYSRDSQLGNPGVVSLEILSVLFAAFSRCLISDLLCPVSCITQAEVTTMSICWQ